MASARKPTARDRSLAKKLNNTDIHKEIAKVKRKQPSSALEKQGAAKKLNQAQTPEAAAIEITNTQAAIEVHGDGPTVLEGQDYIMLSSETPIIPSAKLSCRGHKRETILLNMDSEYLRSHLNTFIEPNKRDLELSDTLPYVSCFDDENPDQLLTAPLETEMKSEQLKPALISTKPYELSFLQKLVSYVRSILRPKENNLSNQCIVPLEWFVIERNGLCRHHALFTSYLLVNIIDSFAKQEGKEYSDTKSRVYRFRTKLKSKDKPEKLISHAVLIYEAENGHRYLLDSTRRGIHQNGGGLAIDLSSLSMNDKQYLEKQYDQYDLDDFIQKIDHTYDTLEEPVLKRTAFKI